MSPRCWACFSARSNVLNKAVRYHISILRKQLARNNSNTTADPLKGPLHGTRVLDLSRVLAGPYCSMILGDLGADVIKIENPDGGDDTRSWGPPFCGSESAYFLSVNRNKRSVCVNIKEKEGQDVVVELAKKSDVLLENYIPGKLSELNLGYEHLSKVAPHLIYCSVTGYGQTGPDAKRAGYDVIVAATGGLTHITGPEDGEPCKVGVAMTDLSTGLYAYGSILAALLHRAKTGRGQHIDCNLLSTQVASLVNIASNYLNADMEAKRRGTSHPSIVPYQAFKSADGYVMAGAGNDKQFQILCKCMGLPDVGESPDYATNRQRVHNRKTLLDILGKRFKLKTTSDWLEVLKDSGIPYGPINNMQQVFSDPQVVHNKMIQGMKHPTAGDIRVAGPAVSFSETPTVLNNVPPLLGEHTRPVLKDVLEMSDNCIDSLIRKGIVK
ncbi:succinate--hydroxymethylglutarate CoA-transferase-like [Mercenaria mercenaria]|uniref:succinate--hydroxymethylglutarate CoA-transferase-like n=1 Tax=Mercenaria mercenaria TaxID=6596 RepID=UPI00234EF7BB|nr:succinate--hydroxymethylglutarate CoA-transferase-like [Mercenaria mercenaria]